MEQKKKALGTRLLIDVFVRGYECGIGLENFSDVKQGDIIENYIIEEVKRKLDAN